MLRLDDAVDRVRKQLALEPSEASLYVRLCVGGPAKVSDLSDALGLHRNEVYRMAEKLTARGLVQATEDRPARLAAVPPETTFDQALTQRLARVEALKRSREEISTLVTTLDARAASASQAKSTYKLLRGRPEIYRERRLLIESARHQVDWASSFPEAVRLSEEAGHLAVALRRVRAGLRHRILVPETSDARERLRALASTPGAEVRWLDLPGLVRFTLADDDELLMFVVNGSSTSLQAEDEVAIHTTAPGFVHAQRAFFESAWNTARPYRPEDAK